MLESAMMRPVVALRLTLPIALLALVLATIEANAACLYERPQTVREEFSNSRSVVIGKVLYRSHMPQSGKYYDGENYVVKVREILKGPPSKTVTVFCENSSGRFPMTVGRTYLIFVYYDGRYQIDNCGNSGPVTKKKDLVKAVRLLAVNGDASIIK
jgi:hypothetical protein